MIWCFTSKRDREIEMDLLKERVLQLERAVGGDSLYTRPGSQPGVSIYVDYVGGSRYNIEHLSLTDAVQAIIEKLGLIIQRHQPEKKFLIKGEK